MVHKRLSLQCRTNLFLRSALGFVPRIAGGVLFSIAHRDVSIVYSDTIVRLHLCARLCQRISSCATAMLIRVVAKLQKRYEVALLNDQP